MENISPAVQIVGMICITILALALIGTLWGKKTGK